MNSFDELKEVVRHLRAEDGCPWDREQTHASLKATCIEEAAEVLCGTYSSLATMSQPAAVSCLSILTLAFSSGSMFLLSVMS